MPIIWRYLFQQYIKVLSLSTCAFIIILMTLRMKEIASFASFGASALFVWQFALNQMIFMLPFALPISCFLSAILLVQRLSATHELTAMRALGFSFKDIFTPLILASILLGGVNFILVSEAATWANASSQQLKKKLKTINPLVLLHNKHLMDLKGMRFLSLGPSKIDEYVNQAVLVASNKENTKLHLMVAKYIENSGDLLVCENMTLITNLGAETEKEYDKLLVENMAKATTPSNAFASLLQDKGSSQSFNVERLRLSPLLKHIKQDRARSEIARRVSSALSPITFTLMGLAFGINISRRQSKIKLVSAVLLLALYLVIHLLAKDVKNNFPLSIAVFLIPNLLIVSLSFWKMNRLAKGIAS